MIVNEREEGEGGGISGSRRLRISSEISMKKSMEN